MTSTGASTTANATNSFVLRLRRSDIERRRYSYSERMASTGSSFAARMAG